MDPPVIHFVHFNLHFHPDGHQIPTRSFLCLAEVLLQVDVEFFLSLDLPCLLSMIHWFILNWLDTLLFFPQCMQMEDLFTCVCFQSICLCPTKSALSSYHSNN